MGGDRRHVRSVLRRGGLGDDLSRGPGERAARRPVCGARRRGMRLEHVAARVAVAVAMVVAGDRGARGHERAAGDRHRRGGREALRAGAGDDALAGA